jgi:CRP/FNR family cyclic AMP-dependent transcriptional regulator
MTVSAVRDAVAVRISKDTLTQLLHEQVAFSYLFMSHILNGTRPVEADLIDQLFNSSERLLARLLLLWRITARERKPDPILAKIINYNGPI